jgi:hypothetical protein
MILKDDLNREQSRIASLIADMEYKKPPRNITDIVMQRIAPVYEPWWRRAISWLLTPRVIRISPLVPVCALAGVLILIIFLNMGSPVNIHMNLNTVSKTNPAEQAVSPNINTPNVHTPNINTNDRQVVNVVFTLHVENAHEVALIGSFNNWQGHNHKLKQSDEDGKWTISVSLEQGAHEYAFVVDENQIIPDPVSLVYKDDGFGNVNSVILIDEQT